MPLNEDSDIGAKIWLRRLRSRTATAGKTSLQKVNLRFFNLHRDYSNSLILSDVCALFWNWIPTSLTQVQEKKKCDARAKLFFCLLNLLFFEVLVAASPSSLLSTHAPTQEAYIAYPRLHFIVCTQWTNTGNVYGAKIFKPKIIGGYPTENFFRKIVNPREHSNRRRR